MKRGRGEEGNSAQKRDESIEIDRPTDSVRARHMDRTRARVEERASEGQREGQRKSGRVELEAFKSNVFPPTTQSEGAS